MAEVIYTRADAEKEFMGLTTFAGNQLTLREAVIAKNLQIAKRICLSKSKSAAGVAQMENSSVCRRWRGVFRKPVNEDAFTISERLIKYGSI